MIPISKIILFVFFSFIALIYCFAPINDQDPAHPLRNWIISMVVIASFIAFTVPVANFIGSFIDFKS